MSQENIEVVRRCYEDYLSGDIEAALAAFDPEVSFELELMPEGEAFRGREGVDEAMRTWREMFDDWRFEIEEMIDAGDRVLVLGTEFGRGKGSGVEIEQPRFNVWWLRNGRVVRYRSYLDRDQALEAAGLRE
jgi:uncharacterized protein